MTEDDRRCPVCHARLAGEPEREWCPRCAIAAVCERDPGTGDDRQVLFEVEGHAVLSELGRGAAGIVYRARQEHPAREVALKMLRPHEAGSAESRARFLLEAATVAKLDHPAILPVWSVGEHDGLPYFTMKFCAAGSLAERRAAYRGKWRATAELVATLADAVDYAHVRGVLHRDLKPGNILFDERECPFVSDFGLAKAAEAAGERPLTQPLLVMGTPGYLAPEVLAGGMAAATTAADVYALGAMLRELLTGAPPGATTRPAGVPRDLATICAHALRPDPAARYHSAESLAGDLRAFLAHRPIAARPVSGFGRMAAWMRRNPTLGAVATALALTLLTGTVMLALKNRALRAALAEAQAAEARAQASLADSLLAQARAVRQSGREGQRREALELLKRAARIRPTSAQRDEATAALLLPDWEAPVESHPWPDDSATATPTPDFSACLVEDAGRHFILRSVADGTAGWSWTAPAASASHPVFSPDGRWVALHLRNDEVQVLSVADGTPAARLTDRPYAFKGQVWLFGQDVDFSPDGSLLAVARPQGGVSFHRPADGEAVRSWDAPERVTTMQFSPDGARLAIGGGREPKDSILAVVDVATARTLIQEKPGRRVEFTSWSPDGRWLAVRASGGNAEVRAAASLALRAVLPDRAALHGQFLPDGDRLLLTQQLGATRLWAIDRAQLLLSKADAGRPGNWWSGEPLRQWRSYRAGPVVRQRFADSPVFRTRSSGEANYTVPEPGWPGEISADGRHLAVGGWGGGIVWNLATGRAVLRVAKGGTRDAGGLRFDPDGGAVWVNLVGGGLWRLGLQATKPEAWSTDEGEQIDAERGFHLAAANRASGRLALVQPEAGEVKIIDTRARRLLARWPHAGATKAEFSPDGMHLVVNGNANGAPATVYAATTGALVRVLGQSPGRMARWSPGGTWVLAGDGKDNTRLWHADSWKPGPELPKEAQDWNLPAAFSADDRLLVLRTSDDFQLYDLARGATVLRLAPPEGISFVCDVFFAGRQGLGVVNLDGRVFFWDLAAMGKELSAIGLDAVPAEMNGDSTGQRIR